MSRRPARVTARVAPRPDLRRWILIAAAVATAAAALTSVAGAQHAPEPESAPVANVSAVTETDARPVTDAPQTARAATAFGPRLGDGLVSYKPAANAELDAVTSNERERMRPASRNNAALIVVGLSAMVIGSFVDDDAGSVIVLGGAGLTIFGLWQYLK